ncbi:hypothetical protein Afil01_22400 [Actinorhabdospora filicis]|uniref:Uncharacterized protein n=1 Tax=Actinorhabdospora filicis TaxID=1785913 RepID=A0A9W6SJK4_9ACTN|nr:hypothetical protein [Actinorhabdospora filicis]GLZ77433.1 hypothetical protein Afil01_22400 [Actinorhabdospora filicis]
MSAYDDFVAFVHGKIHDLRREAHQVTGDDGLTDQLVVLALARLAARYQSTRDLDPAEAEQAAYDALAAETGPLLRGGDEPVDTGQSEYEESVHRAATPLELADAAWARGRRLRRRRWRRIVITLVIVALLLTFYQLASGVETPPEPDPHADDPTRTAYLMHEVDLLPSAPALARAPKWTDANPAIPSLPASITLEPNAPPVSGGTIDVITAAAQSVNGGPVYLIDSKGFTYLLDGYQPNLVASQSLKSALTKHAVAPGGKRILLAQDDAVVVVERDGTHRSYPVPLKEGAGAEVADASWYGDTAVLLTQRGGTALLDVTTGTWTTQPFQGTDAVPPTAIGPQLYTLTPGPLNQYGAYLDAVAWDLPTATATAAWKSEKHLATEATWISSFGTFGEMRRNLVAKECEVRDGGLDMPEGYGAAQDCLLIADVTTGAMTRALVRDSSHAVGVRSGFLGWLDDDVLLLSSMDAATASTLVLAWSLGTGELRLISSIGSMTALALAPGLARG